MNASPPQAELSLDRPHYNLEYYEKVPVEELRRLATVSGVSECKDLDYALPDLKQAKEVLEIGGGYGRVLDYALAHQLKAHFDVLEPSNQFYQYLQQRCNKPILKTQFQLIQSCVEDFHPDKKYDVVLWLWTQINELSLLQIKKVLFKLKLSLAREGKVFIETFHLNHRPTRLKYEKQGYFFVDMEYVLLRIAALSPIFIKNLSEEAGFKKIEFINYALHNGLQRTLIILQS